MHGMVPCCSQGWWLALRSPFVPVMLSLGFKGVWGCWNWGDAEDGVCSFSVLIWGRTVLMPWSCSSKSAGPSSHLVEVSLTLMSCFCDRMGSEFSAPNVFCEVQHFYGWSPCFFLQLWLWSIGTWRIGIVSLAISPLLYGLGAYPDVLFSLWESVSFQGKSLFLLLFVSPQGT